MISFCGSFWCHPGTNNPKYVDLSLHILRCGRFFLKIMGQSRHLFHLFSYFQVNITILHQINVKKCPSSIQCRYLNSQHLEHESSPITTRPGLLPLVTVDFGLSKKEISTNKIRAPDFQTIDFSDPECTPYLPTYLPT